MSEPLDIVRVEGLAIQALVGVYPHEHRVHQRLNIDLGIHADLRRAGQSDQLEHTVDYDRASAICREVAGSRHHDLIETIAEKIAARILAELDHVREVSVRVAKPGAVPDANTVAVELHRTKVAVDG